MSSVPDRPRAGVARRGIVTVVVLASWLGCSRGAPSGGDVTDQLTHESRAILLDPTHPAWSEPAPDTADVRFETSKGGFTIRVVRAWAPLGADRFVNLVRHGYYDDARFHRTVPDFIVQWGLAGDPEVTAAWRGRTLADDPVVGVGNTRGRVAFAFTEPGTRDTQVFVSLVDLSRLDGQGFSPFGEVVQGMEVVDSLHSGYGETSGGGMRAGAQDSVALGGNRYLDAHFPRLDRIIRARIVAR
ncbi:MAG: peptidylprolyl isomerase [Gemmatimonadota bacterium]|nr:peptidylprolyl isomerase [Gemmatimonadota bacterium]MDH5759744.1 peptidylprolyl isomerase [Gemmatimonadota bacterium]